MTDKLPFNSLLSDDELKAIQDAYHLIMSCMFGDRWEENDSLRDTPKRVAKYLAEFNQPLPYSKIFGSIFDDRDSDGMVAQVNIPFRMICEHHLIPATGRAHLGYIPDGKVIGLSKLARLVDAVGVESPSLQEHIAHRIGTLLLKHLKPRGVMVVIESVHGCMACRGVNKPDVVTTTSHVWGVFRDVRAAREEFLALIKNA